MAISIEIIAIGNELTSGRIQNTTSDFAARMLYEEGYEIYAINTIGDEPELIGDALNRAISRTDVVLVTGGLGCTDDDLTTEAVAKALNLPKVLHQEILDSIAENVGPGPMLKSLEKLAWLPEGAIAFDPSRQMSGYQLNYDDRVIFFLPGVPEQAQLLLEEEVLPGLKRWSWGKQLHTRQRLYRIFGIQEGEVNSIITGLELGNDVQIGYYPKFPEVHLTLTVRCKSRKNTENLFLRTTEIVERALGKYIFAHDRQTMAAAVGELLLEKGQWMATAESCTGGLISEQITGTPGSSGYFLGGVVSYANSMKIGILGVQEETLARVGAVSREVAEQMAEGIRIRSGADFGIAVTGIAGPGGGTPEKPVGTVYIGLAEKDGVTAELFHFSGNRVEIRQITAISALNMLRVRLLG